MAAFKKYLIPLVLLLLGVIAGSQLIPYEQNTVETQFIGYPDSDKKAHQIRVYLLGLMCLLPFLCSILYYCLDTLDRYTVRIFLNCFVICFGALFCIMMLEDIQDNISDFHQSSRAGELMMKHYIIKLPALIVFILPYSLMLSLLWALGKMSKSQEIVSIIQTGRGVVRLIRPLIGIGLICTIIYFIFNYHWSPHSQSQEDQILREAKDQPLAVAEAVVYQNNSDTRQWYVGIFPFNHSQGEPLRSVEIIELKDSKAIAKIIAEEALWSNETRTWTLKNPTTIDLINLTKYKMPTISLTKGYVTKNWQETPYQIVKPGLKPPFLGIPGLKSWLMNNRDHPLSDRRSYQTHLYYRYAQPFICLITILLAAPLGIVFTRRGVGGGVAVAIFLCAGMIFCSTVFPTLGESGHLPPFVAAWATNTLFILIALTFFYRRMTGQPIYQTIKNLLPKN